MTIPKFKGTNWYEVKSQFVLALSTVYGQKGVPLSYLTRESRVAWEDTEDYETLQRRRVDTKAHSGADFNKDNLELYRILGQELDKTTLEDVVKGVTRSNGVEAWRRILANVEGANYRIELRRNANSIANNAFWDPARNFSFEAYFQKHTQYHDMMQKAGDLVSDWQKIENFMEGIRCEKLQNIFVSGDYDGMTFTKFYNDMHEKYRRLIALKQIQPVSIFKRKISQVGTNYQGRRGRGRGRGGRGGRFNRGGGRGRGRGRGRGGRGENDITTSINWNLLPQGLDLNSNLTFDDNIWYNMNNETQNEIKKLRKLQNHRRNLNSMLNITHDDNSTVGSRSIFSVNVPNQGFPPIPPQHQAQQPTGQNNNNSSTRSDNAGAAFGPSS